MSRCALCRRPCEDDAPGDTGGPGYSCDGDYDRGVLDSLAGCRQGWYRGCRIALCRVNLATFRPVDAQALSVAAFGRYPAGVVVFHAEHGHGVLFTATGEPNVIHARCALELLKLRLSVGLVVGRGGVFALKMGKRVAPLVRLLRP